MSDDVNNDNLCTMIIFLMIKVPHERYLRHGENKIQMQFRLYKVRIFENLTELFCLSYCRFIKMY